MTATAFRAARRSCRSRRFRVPLERRMRLTDCDREVVRYLVYLGFAPAPALYLFARLFRRPASQRKDLGLGGFAKRCTTLFHAGVLSRFDPAFSRYVHGGRAFVYCVENGRAAAVAARGTHYARLSDDDWRAIHAEAAGGRAALLDLLVDLDFSTGFAEARLDGNARTACKFVSGETSLLPHTLLASTWLAIVWFGFLTRGCALAAILPDSQADLSFWTCSRRPCRPGPCQEPAGHGALRIAVQPDTLFVADGLAVALEAETGQVSRGKIEEKIARYLAFAAAHDERAIAARLGVDRVSRFVCIFHCASGAHAARIADAIARARPAGSELFRITTVDDLSLEATPDGAALHRAAFLANSRLDTGERLYDFFAARISAPIFARVEGQAEDGHALVGCEPLV
jgi:hypothetical protein